ncbi:DUF4254 domain-containing protein [Nocardia brasiliensis]|uniref:DUF4254 domain-containing protein n=1 Tax=Nocardia brasiliensis TaxID=37326 RepID=UPI002456FB96|nr:DUF4254 domain-containing protein [Nocardia brasiliensis]
MEIWILNGYQPSVYAGRCSGKSLVSAMVLGRGAWAQISAVNTMDSSHTGFPRRHRRLLIEGADAQRVEPLLSAAELLDAIRGKLDNDNPLARWAYRLADLHRGDESADDSIAAPEVHADLVYDIDVWVERIVPQHRRGGTVHTETMGSVIDRIAAAQVHADALLKGTATASAPEVHAAWYRLAELVDGYNDLVTAVVSGHRRLPVPGPDIPGPDRYR